MKITAKYLKRIIKEELQATLYDDSTKREIIHAFTQAIETQDENKLFADLQNIGFFNPLDALKNLSRDEVDPQFYQNAVHMHNLMAGEDEQMKIDAFTDFPKPDSDAHRTPDEYFMRSPKLPTSTAQIDYRRGEKNYIQEKK